jgi:hypothetical protein
MTEVEWLLSEDPDAMLVARWDMTRERELVSKHFAEELAAFDPEVDDATRAWLWNGRLDWMMRGNLKLTSDCQAKNHHRASVIRCLVPCRKMDIIRSETVTALVRGIVADNAFDRMPILADALEEAGNDDPVLLGHCRNDCHEPECWVIGALLGR